MCYFIITILIVALGNVYLQRNLQSKSFGIFLLSAAPGISASPSEENMRYFNVMILGPSQSPYEGTSSNSLSGARKAYLSFLLLILDLLVISYVTVTQYVQSTILLRFSALTCLMFNHRSSHSLHFGVTDYVLEN